MRYVCGFLFCQRELVWLIEKQKPAWQKGLLNGIGGKIEDDEKPHAAMAREFLEETGHPTTENDWERALMISGPQFEVSFFRSFWEGDRFDSWTLLKATTNEIPRVASVSSLPSNTIPNLRWIIPMLLDENLQPPVHVSYR